MVFIEVCGRASSDLLLVLLDELHIFLVLLHLFEAVEELGELFLVHLGQVHC